MCKTDTIWGHRRSGESENVNGGLTGICRGGRVGGTALVLERN